ncbi:MAG TPA: hypothetical protein PLS95_14890 [Thermoanaerobaculales bacterium]|nr:hypothetical protein [Thermoanaerobaculales bacterium]HQN97244.1 hypothetical protein [Thermoanaerobaculales bacterium]HQP42846.1 hypothetical protein [Thermoanaerobaculales bacterium]
MTNPDLLTKIEELEREVADLKRHAAGGASWPADWISFLSLPTATQHDLRVADPNRATALEETYYRDIRIGRRS